MLRLPFASAAARYCDGYSRRSFLSLGMSGLGSMSLANLLQARESNSSNTPRAKSVILFWLDGGPSHLDLYDMKPDAPSEYRGIWQPQKTNVPGIEISELLTAQSKVADKFAILRSLHHDNGDHFTAAHWVLTSRGGPNGNDTAGKNPYFGAIAAKSLASQRPGIPAHVAVPHASSVGLQPGYFGGSYLGNEFNPFIAGDPNAANYKVKNLSLETGLTLDRLNQRAELRTHFDRIRSDLDHTGAMDSLDKFQQGALNLITSPQARQAFEITQESDAMRDRYGRNQLGQSTLLARRLVEAGVTIVSIHSGGWDHHWDLKSGYEKRIPEVDLAFATLLSDLEERGLLDSTLVLLCGEFSRTPKMNDGGNGGPPGSKGTPGRDHWGNSMFCLLAGGGVRGGQTVGATDRRGERPSELACTPGDLHTTIYYLLGVDAHQSFLNHSGRPVPAVDNGRVIQELLS
jgi:hypothetical protein